MDSKTADVNSVKFTIDDPQVLGAGAGNIYISVQADPYEESLKVKVAYTAEPRAASISSVNARFTPGNVRILTIFGLEGGETIRVYSDSALTNLVATGFSNGTSATINLPSAVAVQGQRLYLVSYMTNKNPSATLVLTVPDPNNVPRINGTITINTMNDQGSVVNYEDGFGPTFRIGEGNQTITGRVVDSFGTGIANVRVSCLLEYEYSGMALTDSKGNFTITMYTGYTGGHSGWFGYTIHHYDVKRFVMIGENFNSNTIDRWIYQLAYTTYNPSF